MSKARSLLVTSTASCAVIAAVLAFSGSKAISAPDSGQNKYSVQVPDGLSFSVGKGYENWEVVAVSQTEEVIKLIVANPTMMEAYRAGIPGDGSHYPEGSNN